MATENKFKESTMIIKREQSCLATTRKCENKINDKYKQMRSNRQNDKFEQRVMNMGVKDEVLGSILGSIKQKVFFLV